MYLSANCDRIAKLRGMKEPFFKIRKRRNLMMKRCFVAVALCVALVFVLGFVTSALAERTVTVTADFLRVRLVWDSSIIGQLPYGTKIYAVSEDNDWVYYYYEGQYCKSYKGYVVGLSCDSTVAPKATTKTSTTSKPTQEYRSNGRVTLKSGYLNVRKDASKKSNSIGKLYDGDVVEIYGEKGNFYYIQFGNRKAYVSKDFVTLLDNLTLANGEEVQLFDETWKNNTGYTITLTWSANGSIVIQLQQ